MSATLSPSDREKLIQAALEAGQFAYNKYSKLRVGAALLTPDGTIIKGANVENASYGGTICAERTAIVKAVSDGMLSFVGLAVTSDLRSPITPCGLCRQVIREFCGSDMPIFLIPGDYPHPPRGESQKSDTYLKSSVGADGVIETNIAELLPLSFGPEHLELPRIN